jgi:opacity protein-like surface antigen
MMKKIALALVLALTLFPAASFAQVVVRVGPPARIVERRPPPPDRGYVWIDGYHRWDGAQYVWVPGEWRRPEHPGQRWVAHRWVHHHDGWVLVEGHWR